MIMNIYALHGKGLGMIEDSLCKLIRREEVVLVWLRIGHSHYNPLKVSDKGEHQQTALTIQHEVANELFVRHCSPLPSSATIIQSSSVFKSYVGTIF